MKAGRHADSPWVHDRVEVRRVLETEGYAEAKMHFPIEIVRPIARAMGLIAKYRPLNNWKPEWNVLLGTKSDYSLAGELGLSVSTLAAQRRKFGIPAFTSTINKAEKLAMIQARLTALSDADLLRNISSIAYDTRATSDEIKAERARRGLSHSARYRRTSVGSLLHRLRIACIRAMRQDFPEISLDEMGTVLGITRERVRQIEEKEARAVMVTS